MLQDPVYRRHLRAPRQRADRHDRLLGQHEGRRLPGRLLGPVQGAERAFPGRPGARRAADLLPRQGRLAGQGRRPGRPEHPGAPAGIPRGGAPHDRAGRGARGPLRRPAHRRPAPGAGDLGHACRLRPAALAAARGWREAMEELAAGGPGRVPRPHRRAGFPSYFEQATPILEIESLPIASRPAHRHGARGSLRPARHPVGLRLDPEPVHDPRLVRHRHRVPGFARAHADGWRRCGDVRGLAVLPRNPRQRRARARQVRHGHRRVIYASSWRTRRSGSGSGE